MEFSKAFHFNYLWFFEILNIGLVAQSRQSRSLLNSRSWERSPPNPPNFGLEQPEISVWRSSVNRQARLVGTVVCKTYEQKTTPLIRRTSDEEPRPARQQVRILICLRGGIGIRANLKSQILWVRIPSQAPIYKMKKEFNWMSFILGIIIGIIYFCICLELRPLIVHQWLRSPTGRRRQPQKLDSMGSNPLGVTITGQRCNWLNPLQSVCCIYYLLVIRLNNGPVVQGQHGSLSSCKS